MNKGILIIDDNKDLCFMMKDLFKSKGYDTEMAVSGKEALSKARDKKFSIILLDINLPDLDGIDLMPALKKLNPGVGIIIITAYPTAKNTIKALNNDADGYLEKPFNINDVLSKVRQAIRKQKANKKILKKTGLNPDNKMTTKIRKSESKYFSVTVQEAIDYIKNNYKNQELCGEKVASAIGAEPISFLRKWDNEVKISIIDYINNIRIKKAQELLLKSSFYITSIASEVGLAPDYFLRLFKKAVGLSPTQYRNLNFTKS